MIRSYQLPIGDTLDLGWVVADAAAAERFWRAAAVRPPRPDELPLGLALSLRGGPLPAVELADATVSVHAGHSIELRRPFLAGGRYRVQSRIAEVFEKNGRSGRLCVIVRTAELCDDGGDVVVAIREQQIARWQIDRPVRPPAHDESVGAGALEEPEDTLDVGSTVAVERRRAPSSDLVRAYAGAIDDAEPLFSDRALANRIGLADVIVPGPIQSALFERLLRDRLPAWRLTALSLSFRVSVIVDEPITLRAMVIELSPAQDRMIADLTLENSHGEVAAAGTATLVHAI